MRSRCCLDKASAILLQLRITGYLVRPCPFSEPSRIQFAAAVKLVSIANTCFEWLLCLFFLKQVNKKTTSFVWFYDYEFGILI